MTDATRPPAAPAIHELPEVYRRRWWTLAVLCLSLMVITVGNTGLNLALPRFAQELHATGAELQWVVAGYSLVVAGLLFPAGALGDRFGRKGTLQVGLAVFLVATLLATWSHHMGQLIACRALMGLAAALIMPSTLSIIVHVFAPAERPKAIAIWVSVVGISGTLGVMLSGALLEHFWYGSVFLVNVPILLVALVAGRTLVPITRTQSGLRLDPIGSLLATLAMSAVVFGLIEGPQEGWTSPAPLVAFGLGFLATGAFLRRAATSDHPMIELALFRKPAFSAGAIGMTLLYVGSLGMTFLSAQYLQLIRGNGPLGAAIELAPNALAILLVGPQTPRVARRLGSRATTALGITTWGTGLAIFLVVGVSTPYVVVAIAFALQGAGFALAQPSMTSAIMSAVPHERAGIGSAMNDTARQLGAALGVAVLGSVEVARYRTRLEPATTGLAASLRDAARASLGGALNVARQIPGGATLADAARAAYIAGMHLALWIAIGAAVSAALVVLRHLPRRVVHAGDEGSDD